MKKSSLSQHFKKAAGIGLLLSLGTWLAPQNRGISPAPQRTPPLRETFNLLGSRAQITPATTRESINTIDGRWHMARNRFEKQLHNKEDAQLFEAWIARFQHLKNAPLRQALQEVDKAVDALVTYTSEPRCANDNWQTPIETLKTAEGDCEDYAILKYHTLRQLGVPEEKLLLLVVATSRSDDRLNHATLGVEISPSETVILDNNSETAGMGQLVQERKSPYKLFFVITQNRMWKVDWPPPKPITDPDPCSEKRASLQP